MGEVRIKSGNLCERYTSVGTAQQYSVSLYMFADIQPSTAYTIAFEIDKGSLQYFNENLFTYSQYYVTGTGNKQMLQLNAKANIQKTASTWSDTYGWIIAKNYTGNATVPHWENIQLLEGTYTSETIPEYQPYFLNKPAHQYINGEWIDIPTHHYINGRWQGELTSQSPLRFRADGEMLDWRVEGASGGVGDWDETEQKYRIPVTVNGVTTTLYTDHQLMDGDSIDFTTDQTQIPITTGNNTLTVDTAVKPSKVFIKFEG